MLEHMPHPPARSDYPIGVIGAGFIVRDVQLVAYKNAGFKVVAIASEEPAQADVVAELRDIPKSYGAREALFADPDIAILDVAVPPHAQPEIIRDALPRMPQLKGILAQKPLAMNYRDATDVVHACRAAGIPLAVNQNMRYDQSIRALKTLLDRGELGEPVLATIEMRAIPHWQTWLHEYDRLTLLNMSIHHLDVFRFLFGDPESVYVSARTDPRTSFQHRDGVVLYILEYANGFRASGWDDVWAGPAREGAASSIYIKWRVEGTDGVAEGTIGWPGYPNAVPSTIRYASKRNFGCWVAPEWKEVWFPDAFSGTMGELMDAIATGREPAISGRDNLGTMALVDACYKSLDEHRPVGLNEIREVGREARSH
jgi:predicted dehydrogenase